MKTVEELLSKSLSKEEFDLAMENMLSLREDVQNREQVDRILLQRLPSAAEALLSLFIWNLSPQGHEYWEDIHERLLRSERKILLIKWMVFLLGMVLGICLLIICNK